MGGLYAGKTTGDARVGRGEEAIYIMYSTTTAFLYFASMQEASAGAMLAVNDDVRPEQVVFLPQDDIQSVVQTKSVDVVGTALYNYTDGYGTYLIPVSYTHLDVYKRQAMYRPCFVSKNTSMITLWNLLVSCIIRPLIYTTVR